MMRFAWFALSIVLLTANVRANAGVILDLYGSGTPENSFAYSKAVGIGKGNNPSYVPLKSDAVGLDFLGYVFYPEGTGWLNHDPSFFDEDTIRVFRTFLLSDRDQDLTIAVGIDDGHSVYVNDMFVDGDRFGVESFATLSLLAGVPMKLEVLGYNGPGPSQVSLVRSDNREPIANTPGLLINAEGNFVAAVPEPSTLVASVLAMVTLTVFRWRRGRGSLTLVLVSGRR